LLIHGQPKATAQTLAASRFPHSAKFSNAPAAVSDVRYVDPSPVRADAARLKALGTAFSEPFMNGAVSRHRGDDAHEPAL